MDIKNKMEDARKENKPLSFSISRILGDDTKPKKDNDKTQNDAVKCARVPMATIHHYPPENDNYLHFGKKCLTIYPFKIHFRFAKND